MNPADHCELSAVPPGSIRYYSLLNTTPQRRSKLVALMALADELLELHAGGLATEVLPAKMAWWLDECMNLAGGSPRHPVMRALHAAGVAADEVLDAVRSASNSASAAPADETRIARNTSDIGSIIGRAMAVACDIGPGATLNAAANIGAGDCLFNLVGPHLPTPSPIADDVALRLLDIAAKRLETGVREVDENDGHRMLPLSTMAFMERREIEDLAGRVERLRQPSPPWIALQRLWLAWRCRRQ